MGHMLNNTIQDVLARRARMLGFNTCWVQEPIMLQLQQKQRLFKNYHLKALKKMIFPEKNFYFMHMNGKISMVESF